MFVEPLISVLKDSSRPVFLFGLTPPREGTKEENAKSSCIKFAARSAVLAADGFIVYDIQEENSRTHIERPFPFKKTLDPAWYASLFLEATGKSCVVYKSVIEESLESFDSWIDTAFNTYGHNTFTLVGAPSSKQEYKGPTLLEAMNHLKGRQETYFGSVCIPERHTTKGNESANMVRKIENGSDWFITQGIYSTTPIIKCYSINYF